ncbi:MAG TPA: hypothetical protein DHW82_09150 [Spirochaetia bacterium]|nr:MAG: hypothetical protein A2Y41_02325 [Spirochaetes bacterium GWB1_36_13]HCL57156.1 hypothetical protein [Spirochaetia bacterium]
MEKIILKGKFICFEKEFYGLFLISVDSDSSEDAYMVAAGGSSFISTYSIDMDIEKMTQTIRELLDDGEATLDKSKEIKALLAANISQIRENIKSNTMQLTEVLTNILKNYLKSTVEITVTFEKAKDFQALDLEKEKEEKEKKEEDTETRLKYKIPANSSVIDCFIVLSPIKGKFIKEVKEGDLVLSKIDDTTEQGKKIAELYNLYTTNNKLKPVIGKVLKKFSENAEVIMTLQLTKDLIGLSREDASVKVSFIEPDKIISKRKVQEKQKQLEQRQLHSEEIKIEKRKNQTLFYLGVGLFIVFVIIIISVVF